MNENTTMQVCEMERDIAGVQAKYKPYFELVKANRKLKEKHINMIHTIEKLLLLLEGLVLADLVYQIFIL